MLKLKGIKKVCGETKDLNGYYSGEYLQLNVDKTTGEVWTDYHYSIGGNSWSEYHNENIITVGRIYEKKTMSEISEMVYEALNNER